MSKNSSTISLIAVIMALILAVAVPVNAKDSVIDGAFYKVQITTKVTGDQKTASISITPGPEYHCNMAYPWKLTLLSGPSLPQKTVLKKEDAKKFTEPEVLFEVVTGNSDKEPVKAELKMSLCDIKQCKSEKLSLEW